MFRVAIVEDDEVAALQLQNYLELFGKENNLSVQIGIFRNGAELVGGVSPYMGSVTAGCRYASDEWD